MSYQPDRLQAIPMPAPTRAEGRPNYARRRLTVASAAALGIAAIAFFGPRVVDSEAAAQLGGANYSASEMQLANPFTGTLDVAEGAHVRFVPDTDDATTGAVTECVTTDKAISVPKGTIEEFDTGDNGAWYGVSAEALGCEGDRDGIVWVNHAMATARTADTH